MSPVEVTRELVMRYGWNATAYQLINPGISLWLPTLQDGVVGFISKHGRRVVAGAPVCALDRLSTLVNEWVAQSSDRACYFGAAGRLREMLSSRPDYCSVVIGAQPVWNPQTWQPERISSLRQQFNRARNKGVIVEEWPPAKATNHPDLRSVVAEWLDGRGLPPLHFLVEPDTLDSLANRRTFVATCQGRVVAFVVLSPIPVRKGWLTEQFPRRKDAPNGTVELLLDSAARAVARDGAEYLTMGLVPLSPTVGTDQDGATNPRWLTLLIKWVRAHGRRFYNFEGLDAFKAKFRPEYWEPIFVVSHEARFSPRTLYAIIAAFTQISPIVALSKGLGRAIRQELVWLSRPPR